MPNAENTAAETEDPEHTFDEPPVDDSKCSGRPGCKSNRISQGTGRPWICDTCKRG